MPNVEVHLRRTLCDVRCNALFAHILLAVWLLTPKIQFFLFLPPNQAASAARRHLHIFCANVSVQVRRLVRRNLQRLVRVSFCLPGCSISIPNSGIRFASAPSREGYPGIIILIPNVTGQRTRHLVAGTLDPIVGIFLLSEKETSS